MFVPLHHRVRKGARLSPSLLFVVVMQAESLGTRLIQEYTDACPNSLTVQMLIHTVNVTEQQLLALGVLVCLSCTQPWYKPVTPYLFLGVYWKYTQ